MREIIKLTKISLINGFNIQSLSIKSLKSNKQSWKLLLAIALIGVFAILYIGYCKFIGSMNLVFIQLNQSYYLNALLYNMLSFLIFVFGIPYVMSYFYFSKETEMLLALPIKPRNILLSRFLLLMIFEYILVFLAMAPALIINGMHLDVDIAYYIIGFVQLLIIPIAPLALCTIVIMLIAKVTNLGSKKNLIRGIFLFFVTFLALGFQFYIQKNAMSIEQGEFYHNLIRNNETLINLLGNANPLAKWLGTSLAPTITGRSIVNLLIFIAANLLCFILFIFVGEKVYIGGIIGGNEVESKKKELTEEELSREIGRKSSPYLAIFKADFMTILKTPIYLFNCYGTAIILPIILVFPLLAGGEMSSVSIKPILDMYYTSPDYANFIIAGVLIIPGIITPIASTTFSREGKCFWISRIIPARAKDHIIGRSISAMLAQVFLLIVMVIGLNVALTVNVNTYIIGYGLGILGSVPMILLGMLADIRKPLLNWTNPQRAVKQNMNAIITMLLGTVIILGIGALTWLLLKLAIDSMVIFIIDLFIILVLTIAIYKILEKMIKAKFVELEE